MELDKKGESSGLVKKVINVFWWVLYILYLVHPTMFTSLVSNSVFGRKVSRR